MKSNSCFEEEEEKMNLRYTSWYQQMCVKEKSQRKSLKSSGIQPVFLYKDSFGVQWCLFTFSFCS